MKSSKEAKRLARRLFRASMVNGRLDETRVRRAAVAVGEKRSRVGLQALKEYSRLVRMEMARHQAVVETAEPLSADTIMEIRAGLQKQYGLDVTSDFHLKPSLIGGMRVRVGSDLWDGSVQGRLERLRAAFEII
jgi:F-type H+-transporting ATPase subunit delta